MAEGRVYPIPADVKLPDDDRPLAPLVIAYDPDNPPTEEEVDRQFREQAAEPIGI